MSTNNIVSAPIASVAWRKATAEIVRSAIGNNFTEIAEKLLEAHRRRTHVSRKEALMGASPYSLFHASTWDKIASANETVPAATVQIAIRHIANLASVTERPAQESERLIQLSQIPEASTAELAPVTARTEPPLSLQRQLLSGWKLSQKETEILLLIVDGTPNKEVAFTLKTTEQVVKNYARSIYKKAGVHNRSQLLVIWHGAEAKDQPPLLTSDKSDEPAWTLKNKLTPTESRILGLLAKKNKEIAKRLGTTEQVIKNHTRSIYDKLGVSTRTEATLLLLNNPELQRSCAEALTAKRPFFKAPPEALPITAECAS